MKQAWGVCPPNDRLPDESAGAHEARQRWARRKVFGQKARETDCRTPSPPHPRSRSVPNLMTVPTFIPDGGGHTLSTGLRDRS